MLIVHGTADRVVPYLQAELLAEAIAKTGAPFYLHTVVGGGHGVSPWWTPTRVTWPSIGREPRDRADRAQRPRRDLRTSTSSGGVPILRS